MPKVMLVEDDNNLREIYDARLAAEGYEIVSAHDGEEALALAVKERPDLIISDVMMPKISGFDMLDILRSTPETKNTKVIMMTALGQAEDRARADKLGADRYLVKSQVTLEDVIKVAQEILGDTGAGTTSAEAPAATTAPSSSPTMTDVPVVAAPPAAKPTAAPADPAPATDAPADEPAGAPAPTEAEPAKEEAAPKPEPEAAPTAPTPITVTEAPEITVTAGESPAEPAEEEPKEEAKPEKTPIAEDLTQTKAQETQGVEDQIQAFIGNNPALSGSGTTPAAPTETPTTAPDVSAPAAPATQEELANPTAATAAPQSGSIAEAPSHKKLVLQPTENALAPSVDLDALLAKEEAKETSDQAVATPQAAEVVKPEVVATPTDDKPAGNPNDISL